MLTVLTGRQRTAHEYTELLDTAGFQLERVIPTLANVSILEATPRPARLVVEPSRQPLGHALASP